MQDAKVTDKQVDNSITLTQVVATRLELRNVDMTGAFRQLRNEIVTVR
jgi:hypothetical protein